jgi:hypothetical protein
MNKVIFAKLFVDGEEISRDELGEAVRDLTEASRSILQWDAALDLTRRGIRATNASSPAGEGEAAWSGLTGAELLGLSLAGQGSSKTASVELRGLEPLTPTLPVWCATSCATAPNVPGGRALAQYYTAVLRQSLRITPGSRGRGPVPQP